jgi:glycosyltransferase involved in cell wall biosynthesis
MISLIVATINRITELDRLLTSLDGQVYRNFEVIVVDQNPDDRLAPILLRHPGLAINHLRGEPGLSKARNVGLPAASGKIIAFPDDDCWYPRHLLESVNRWFVSHPAFALLSTALRTADYRLSGPNSPATARHCTKWNVWSCAVSTAIFMRLSVYDTVGDFNEDIGVGSGSDYQSGEETDYVLRALAHGFGMWYEPSLTVHHPPLHSIARLRETTYPFALGTGLVLRMHRYPLHRVGGQLIRSLGGAVVSLCQGDLARAQVYALRGTGQLVGYVAGRRSSRSAKPRGPGK